VVTTGHQVRSYLPNVTTPRTPAPSTGPAIGDPDRAPDYEIRVAGHLAPRWSAWFDGLSVVAEPDGTTVLRGPVVDQAALHGLLQKLRDVGIPLISLAPIHPTEPAEPTARATHEET
jgi:hypothetical protein